MHACQDRTKEFTTIINLLDLSNKKNQTSIIEKRKTKRSQLVNERIKFNKSIKSITNNITTTCLKLDTLCGLIKSANLFDDKSDEIQHVSDSIKSNIVQLTSQIKDLSEHPIDYGDGNETRNHSAVVVDTINKKVKKISNNFNGLLHYQLEKLRKNANQCSALSKPNKNVNSVDSQLRPKIPEFLLEDELKDIYNETSAPSINEFKTQFMKQLHPVDQTDQYLQSRNTEIQNVERTIVDLGGIFQQLSCLIQEQSEQIESIDSAVEETMLNVEAGHSELTKFYESVTNNRWLMIKVFVVIFVFVIIFIVLL